MSFDIFQNIMTASDPAGGRAIKVTLQTGIDDAESYYTKSDSAGGRAIKVSLIGSGALILAGNVPLSTTPTNVADGAGNTSPLQLSTNQVRIGRESNDTPLALFGTKGSLAIFNTFSVGSGDKTFSFPNASMTFAGINIAQTFTATQTFSVDTLISNTRKITNALDASQSIHFTSQLNFNDASKQLYNIAGITRANLTSTGFAIGITDTTASARLHVRGDGTNNIARFENISGFSPLTLTSSGTRINIGENGSGIYVLSGTGESMIGSSLGFRSNQQGASATAAYGFQFQSNANLQWASGTGGSIGISETIAPTGLNGTGNFRLFNNSYSINPTQAQTGTVTGIFVLGIEDNLRGMTHNLMDLQSTIGGTTTSKFKVSSTGAVTSGSLFITGSGYFASGTGNTTGTIYGIQSNLNIVPPAGSANFRPYEILYTINASGAQSGTATGIFLNATETGSGLNGMVHNLMDLQRGGVSQFRVNRVGAFSCGNTVAAAIGIASTHKVTIEIGGTTYYLLASNV